jgi:hypothetical protein
MMSYCEDYPCCGHTPSDPCNGAVVTEPWYCDECGIYHMYPADSDYIRDIHDPEDDDEEWEDDDIPDNVADAMTLSSAYGGDWWDM